MNIIHLKYAIEVAKVGSINKASENLGMAQPNISRAIKDLEADVGIAIFDRSTKGMNLTPEGKEFIAYAQKVLYQLDELENMYKGVAAGRQKFSVSTPRAGYIAEAFSDFSQSVKGSSAKISFKQTGAHNTIRNVISADSKLGIIRFEASADKYFKDMLTEKGLCYEPIASFSYVVLMSKESELCSLDAISEQDLKQMIQITHNDPYAVTLSAMNAHKEDLQENSDRCIYILDTAGQLELLSANKDTYMWVSPAPNSLLERYGLVQKSASFNNEKYMDVLIYRNDYKLTSLDKLFIEKVRSAGKKYL